MHQEHFYTPSVQNRCYLDYLRLMDYWVRPLANPVSISAPLNADLAEKKQLQEDLRHVGF